MSKITLIKANNTHVEFLLTLRKLTMAAHLKNAGIPMSEKQHEECVTDYFSDSLIIQLSNQPIGLIKLSIDSERIHIRQFQLLPKFHNKGIGSRLLRLIQQKAQRLSIPITLNVLMKNPAKSLYIRHGFDVIATDACQYQMRWINK